MRRLVVWGIEFGRTPDVHGQTGGRDHHPPAFSPGWMDGGEIEGGGTHGFLPTNSGYHRHRRPPRRHVTITPLPCISLGSTPRNWPVAEITSVSKSTHGAKPIHKIIA